MVLLLELLQPGGRSDLRVRVRRANGGGKESRLLSDHRVRHRRAGPLRVARPIRESPLDVGKSSFAAGLLDRRSGAVVGKKVFLLLPEHLRYSAARVTQGQLS